MDETNATMKMMQSKLQNNEKSISAQYENGTIHVVLVISSMNRSKIFIPNRIVTNINEGVKFGSGTNET